jgi:1,4-alpha-glucan branching enzyme
MTVFPEKIADDRYSAKRNTKPINFFLAASEAHAVYLIGDFNDWDPVSHPMERQVDGTWLLQVFLTHGHHHYQFLVDGKPVADPRSMGEVEIERRKRVSLIAVS